VEVVTRELKMRTTNINMPRPPETVGGPRGAKRKRTAAPEETCPYCNHVYTVRDGLSTKVDLDGNRCVNCHLTKPNLPMLIRRTHCLRSLALQGSNCNRVPQPQFMASHIACLDPFMC